MLIALPTILHWMIASVATEAILESALRRSKCSVDCFNTGPTPMISLRAHSSRKRSHREIIPPAGKWKTVSPASDDWAPSLSLLRRDLFRDR